MVFSEDEVAKMICEMRNSGQSVQQISKKITFECCTNYNCKDNVTLIIIDLKKHYNDHQARLRKNNQRRYHSQVRQIGENQMFFQQDFSFYTQIPEKFNPLFLSNQVR